MLYETVNKGMIRCNSIAKDNESELTTQPLLDFMEDHIERGHGTA
jgi:Fe-S cluster assembly scaffold protein SufB